MKKIIFISLLYVGGLLNAQVGINTETPQSTLHVSGSLQVTNSLRVGGNESTKGNSGNLGDILVSQGPNRSPMWVKLEDEDIPRLVSLASQKNIANGPATGSTEGFFIYLDFDNQNFFNNDFLSYKNGEYTVKKSGVYEVNASVTSEVLETPTDGTTVLSISKSASSDYKSIKNFNANGIKVSKTSITGTLVLNVNDKILIKSKHTRKFRLNDGKISIVYISKD